MGLSREPVAYASAARVIIVAAGAFGLGLSGEQVTAVVAIIEAVTTLITRSQVTPVGSEIKDPTGVTIVPDVSDESGS